MSSSTKVTTEGISALNPNTAACSTKVPLPTVETGSFRQIIKRSEPLDQIIVEVLRRRLAEMFDRIFQVLVVDDSPADVRLDKEMLRDWKIRHCINVAESALEAMDVLCQRGNYNGAPRPDLILLDINMPVMDGLDLLRWLRKECGIPVVVLTSSGAASDVRAAYNLQANCFIKKPSDLSEFSQVMQQIEMFWFGTATLLPPAKLPVCEANRE